MLPPHLAFPALMGSSFYSPQKDPNSRQVTSRSYLYLPQSHSQVSTAHKLKPRPGVPEPGSASMGQ